MLNYRVNSGGYFTKLHDTKTDADVSKNRGLSVDANAVARDRGVIHSSIAYYAYVAACTM